MADDHGAQERLGQGNGRFPFSALADSIILIYTVYQSFFIYPLCD
jgi:hypothetical protein